MAPGTTAIATAAATAAAASAQNDTGPWWINEPSDQAWLAAARGLPAFTMPTGAMHIAELELAMFPVATLRESWPIASFSAV